MNIWSAEIKELNQIYQSVKGTFPHLEKELEKLVSTNDENMLLVYSRRCLEVIITSLCENELKRHRGTEPLQRIIDKLNKEEIVPHNIIVSMQNVNSMSTFGAHPKEFDMEQVKPVLHNLKTIIKWYLKYLQNQEPGIVGSGVLQEKIQASSIKSKSKSAKRIGLISGLLLVAIVITIYFTNFFNIKGEGFTTKSGTIGSIVVLPFSNYTGQDSIDWLLAGMHSALIQNLGKISGLLIPGTTTSQVFKDSHKTIKEITSECNVDAALEMTALYLGVDSFWFQPRLIKAGQREEQIWTADYKIARNEVLNWYDAITKKIAEEVNVKLTPNEEKLLSKSRFINREVYEDYLKANQYWGDVGKESLQKALEYLNNAIKEEPGWAPLYSGLAQTWLGIQQNGFEPPSVAMPEIYRNLNKALELDPNLSEAHYLNAMIAHLVEWDWEKSEKEFLEALAVNPNDAQSRALYAQLLCILQRSDEGVAQGRLALEIDPLNPYVKIWVAAIFLCIDDCKTALDIAEGITATDPGNYLANQAIFISAYKCKEYDKVINAEKYNLPLFNITEDDMKEIDRIFNEQGFIKAYERIMINLEKFAEKNPVQPIEMAIRYIMADQPDKAMDWLEKGYERHDPVMTYIATKIYFFDSLFNNPRFIAILEIMNLPLPKID